MAPTLWQALGTFVPVVVVVIASWFTWRHNRAISRTEGRKVDLAEYEALNKAQAAELERERKYRAEDAQRYADRIARLERQAAAGEDFADQLMLWVEEIAGILRRPQVAAILLDEGVTVPAAPTEPRREYV